MVDARTTTRAPGKDEGGGGRVGESGEGPGWVGVMLAGAGRAVGTNGRRPGRGSRARPPPPPHAARLAGAPRRRRPSPSR